MAATTAVTAKDAVFYQYGVRVQRLRNWFRLIFAVLLALAVTADTSVRDRPDLFALVAAEVLLGTAGLVLWYRRPPREHFVLVVDVWGVLDVLIVLLLQQLSHGSYLLLLFLFFLPVFSAFNLRREPTAVTLVCNAAALLVAILSDPLLRTRMSGLDLVVVFTAHLLLCSVVLAITTTKRSLTRRIADLLDARSALLTDVMTAEERERRTLAEVLHDETLQTLLAARHDLEEYTDSGDRSALDRLDTALTSVARSLRRATYELHPAVLETAGLASALESLTRVAAERGKLSAQCTVSCPSTVHDRLLYSVARELIANVVRHAQASRLQVELTGRPGRLLLTVTDDGKGFDPAVLRSGLAGGHIGVASHRVRVEAAGGDLEYLDVPVGTRARVTLPVDGIRTGGRRRDEGPVG
ncbi:hypothetical protein Slala03_74760 [Streptomyces lavendulae subsp. lavendulae]|uniref:sensor histidine kinase n=1 Tax=Streptomyces lavendulae TaxID=1914 RepID=UPI0024A3CF5D|nr:ATP-binding protein [Streptomyces lavendulae]GLV87787.1 hypothetical protein Slala03_74760 [Streptomyces lavendulae subsp. lavendulae]